MEALQQQYEQLKAAAQQRLGSLYNPLDYPPDLRPLFEVQWEFPSVQPPEYLLRLNPQLYQQEQQRISARFEEAVTLAEQAFVSELGKLVQHLVERLSGAEDGKPKTFRDSAIGNLHEFFDRFKSLNVHSSGELDQLVETAQKAIEGVQPQAVRDSDSLRQHLSSQLTAVASSLDHLLIEQPRRRILRSKPEGS